MLRWPYRWFGFLPEGLCYGFEGNIHLWLAKDHMRQEGFDACNVALVIQPNGHDPIPRPFVNEQGAIVGFRQSQVKVGDARL